MYAPLLTILLVLAPAQEPVQLTEAEETWLTEHPSVRVRPSPRYEPIDFVGADGIWRGISADILALVAERVGLSLEVVPYPADGSPPDLEGYEADLVPLSAPTATREELWFFGNPYLVYPVRILTRTDVEGERTLADLAGKTCALVDGWAIEEFVERNAPGVLVVPVNSTQEGLQLVSTGSVDAFLSDLPSATWAMQDQGIANLRVAGDSGCVYRMGLSVRRDWPTLFSILEKGLATVSPAERADIHDRWVRIADAPGEPFLSQRVVFVLSVALTVIGAILAGVVLWNRSLRREVERYGQRLREELDERLSAERERTRLERELRIVHRMDSLGRIAGGIAHDFNNILGSVVGYGELAKQDLPVGSPVHEHIDEILRASDRARSLVQQILTFSRQTEQVRTPCDLRDVVHEAMRLLRVSLPKSVEVRERLSERPCVALADASQLHQIVLNLGTNAAHAIGGKPGRLEISVAPAELGVEGAREVGDVEPGSYVEVIVRDSGHGMDTATIERAFDPFFTTKDVGEGTGLGLSVVHGIVSAHGGGIRVESSASSGTAFHVFLPRAEDDIVVPPRAASRRREIAPGEETVLVVDDEKALVQLIEHHLRRRGYHVVSFTDPQAALDEFVARPEAYDLLVTDQAMPGMTGVRLAQQAHRIRAGLPVVLVTGYGHTDDAELLEDAGIEVVLRKPYTGEDLIEVVRAVLDRGGRQPSPDALSS